MKKVFIIGVVILLAFGVAYAAQDVKNTKHNLSTSTSTATRTFYLTAGTDEVCVFCHTPHFSTTTPAGMPLWNRTSSTATYTMYNSSVSATMDMTVAGTPQGVSAACLSCHDGTVAFDSLVNKPGSGIGAPSGWTWSGGLTNITTSTNAYIGADLSNDHPISITYSTTADPQFKAITDTTKGRITVGTSYVQFYGSGKDQVECGSCHDPHEKDVATFLRVANTGSQLCLGCHIK